ncbi:MAG: hypothetical protein IJ242_15365 [Clostridia bacterium]|nr:hypothetical protein [Clostridia bacterium]
MSNHPSNDLKSLYLDAVRSEIIRQCKKKIFHDEHLHKPFDETLFDEPEYKQMLDLALAQDTLYQASVSEQPFENIQIKAEFEALTPFMRDCISAGSLNLKKCRLAAKSKAHAEDKKKAKAVLQKLSIPDYIYAHEDEYVTNATIVISDVLRSQPLTVSFRKKNRHSPETALQITNIDQFFLQLENRRTFPKFALFALDASSIMQVISREIFRSFPMLEKTPFITTRNDITLTAEINNTASIIADRFWDKLFALFPKSRILDLLKENERYSIIVETLENVERNKRSLHATMLSSIPDQYKDLYPAARAMQRNFTLHIGPTNSGKTYDAINALMQSQNGIYLAPLRLLAYEQYEKINRAGIPCSLLTGEEQELVGYAKIQSSTIEMADLDKFYDIAVIDEAQMIADPDRGGAWTSCILGLCAKEIHVCASKNAEMLLTRIIEDCGDSVTVVRHKRQTPLLFESRPFHFPEDARSGDALIVFSKRDVHAVSAELQKQGKKCSIIYGALPYDVRHRQAELFASGENDIVVATDAIGMGMNLPIQRVVFLDNTKFDGFERRNLNSSEIKQIGGRAGRFGVYPKGFVAAMQSPPFIRNGLSVKDQPLAKATIEFPESLIELDAPLVDILERWDEIEPHAGWDKAATSRMLFLARRLQPFNESNTFCYNFITLPFDETEPSLLSLWDAMVISEHKGQHFDILSALPRIPPISDCRSNDLDNFEYDYHLCDLFYNYVRHFCPDEDTLFDSLNQCKYEISSAIMHILSTQRLNGRRCLVCNRPLPWNSPYKTCYRCHMRGY